MVRLAAHIPTPLIYGEGNWGKYPNEEAAAERYTTCRFSKFGYKVLFDPYYIRVSEMVPNYDGTTQEPSVLPALLPMSLIVPQSGIAVAVSTNIPSFTPESIIKTVSQMLKLGKSPSPKWLSENLEWSSAYGGKVISSSKDLIPVMKDGYGKVEWECDYSYDGKNTIIIRGIPPEWNIDGKIAAMAKEKYVAEISDQTDKDGLKIVIRLKRTNEENIDENIQKIMKHLRTTQTISINCLSISVKDEDGFKDTDSNFKRRSVIDILEEWLEWRIALEVKALNYELDLVEESLKKDRLLKQTIESLDLIFSILKKKGVNKVEELAKKMGISIKESEYIWSIAVGRLDKLSEVSINESISKSVARKKQINLGLKAPKESTLTQLSSMRIPVDFKRE
jgi:DNA gyrase subunit A